MLPMFDSKKLATVIKGRIRANGSVGYKGPSAPLIHDKMVPAAEDLLVAIKVMDIRAIAEALALAFDIAESMED